MRYVIMAGDQEVQVEVGPQDGSSLVMVKLLDGTPVAGLDLYANARVALGHWPDGEEWVEVAVASPVREDGDQVHYVGDNCLAQHEVVERSAYLACGQDFMAGTICSLPAGHLERDGTDHA